MANWPSTLKNWLTGFVMSTGTKDAFSWQFSQFSAIANDFGQRTLQILSNLVKLAQAQYLRGDTDGLRCIFPRNWHKKFCEYGYGLFHCFCDQKQAKIKNAAVGHKVQSFSSSRYINRLVGTKCWLIFNLCYDRKLWV